jgi:hypothetical protein
MGRWWVILGAGVFILAWSLIRDIRYSKEYPGDLRYRIVGARLVRDGGMPYWYKWKKGDGLRYYDPDNFDNLKAANITVSPFYLHLLSPIADLPEGTIIWLWLVSEYAMLAGLTVFCFFLAKRTEQKQAVVVAALLFLLTNAWKSHINNGQTYLWIPFIAMLFLACLLRPGHWAWGFAAGALAGGLVLFRINTLFFFPAFLFLARRYTRGWWVAFGLPLLLLAGWTGLDGHERELWVGYKGMLQEYLKLNQDLGPTLQRNDPDPRFSRWEGIDKPAADSLLAVEPDRFYSENGNVFVLFRLLFHRQLPYGLLETAAIVLMAALCGCFYFLHRPFNDVSVAQVAVFAYCLYMISDLFSPIYRHQYYTVQWLFPLLVTAAVWSSRRRTGYWLVAACLVVSAVHFPFAKMQNTVAEYAIMAILLGFSLLSKKYCTQGG